MLTPTITAKESKVVIDGYTNSIEQAVAFQQELDEAITKAKAFKTAPKLPGPDAVGTLYFDRTGKDYYMVAEAKGWDDSEKNGPRMWHLLDSGYPLHGSLAYYLGAGARFELAGGSDFREDAKR